MTNRTSSWIYRLFIALAFVLILFAATYRLSEAPAIWFDEGMYTQTALNLEKYGTQALQVAPGEFASAGSVTGGFPFIAPISLSYKLFGPGVLQGRVVMVFFILAFAIASYACTRMLFGAWYSAWTIFLLSSFAMLYGNGKNVLGEVPGLFFLLLAALALVYLERSSYRSPWAYACTGLSVGLCVATKPIFLLLIPALALVWLVRRREIRVRWGGFALGVSAFIVPIVVWLYLQFNGNDSLASILSFYVNPYNTTNVAAVVTGNVLRFFTEITPLYTLALLAVWGAAIFIRKKTGEKPLVVELVLFIFSLIVVAAFLRMPGWYRYIFPATTVALLFLPYALVRVFEYVGERFPIALRAAWLPYALLFLMICGQFYQVAYSSYVADYYGGHRTRDVGSALAALPAGASIFVYNAPEVVVLLPSSNYYQYIKPHATDDGESAGVEQLALLTAGRVDYVIINSGNYAPENPYLSSYRLAETANRYSILKKI